MYNYRNLLRVSASAWEEYVEMVRKIAIREKETLLAYQDAGGVFRVRRCADLLQAVNGETKCFSTGVIIESANDTRYVTDITQQFFTKDRFHA